MICIPVHFLCGMFGLIAVGLFGEKEIEEDISNNNGVFKGGSISYLGYQILTIVCIASWSAVVTAIEVFIAYDLLTSKRTYVNFLSQGTY